MGELLPGRFKTGKSDVMEKKVRAVGFSRITVKRATIIHMLNLNLSDVGHDICWNLPLLFLMALVPCACYTPECDFNKCTLHGRLIYLFLYELFNFFRNKK